MLLSLLLSMLLLMLVLMVTALVKMIQTVKPMRPPYMMVVMKLGGG